ncbi:uncharacterized protein LOC130997804 isoform X2 [Salvia miltiorrhiza]|uniref:uncharacterized protein LOC130997804 isoform X2 n=1 Tax=Salvia miltiorrhiza TaxID=226208 RepID=UPI0025AC49C3|nr:uncharacterized protein LOC130997804 isoform X2 [Salvia miltiorrhiza]
MAVVSASLVALGPNSSPCVSPSQSCSMHSLTIYSSQPALVSAIAKRRALSSCTFALENNNLCETSVDEEENDAVLGDSSETLLYSFSPLPLLLLAALPGATTVTSLISPFVELVKSWSLPGWLVHWGHPANMEEKAKAKDLHPKLLGGMFFFFALGATGGITSLLTSDRPIFQSPHAVTGFIGLALLTIQTLLPTLFEGNPGLRNIHGILGSGIMTLFVVHAALGLQLGLSY